MSRRFTRPRPSIAATAFFEAQAAERSFVAPLGIGSVIALLLAWVALLDHDRGFWRCVEFCIWATVLWGVALRGYRVRIRDGVLEYRNPLYITQRCHLGDIQQCVLRWEASIHNGVRHTRLMLYVKLRTTDPLRIPMPPFSPDDQAHLRELLGAIRK